MQGDELIAYCADKDLTKLAKSVLQNLCSARGVPRNGNRDDLIFRLKSIGDYQLKKVENPTFTTFHEITKWNVAHITSVPHEILRNKILLRLEAVHLLKLLFLCKYLHEDVLQILKTRSVSVFGKNGTPMAYSFYCKNINSGMYFEEYAQFLSKNLCLTKKCAEFFLRTNNKYNDALFCALEVALNKHGNMETICALRDRKVLVENQHKKERERVFENVGERIQNVKKRLRDEYGIEKVGEIDKKNRKVDFDEIFKISLQEHLKDFSAHIVRNNPKNIDTILKRIDKENGIICKLAQKNNVLGNLEDFKKYKGVIWQLMFFEKISEKMIDSFLKLFVNPPPKRKVFIFHQKEARVEARSYSWQKSVYDIQDELFPLRNYHISDNLDEVLIFL